MIDLLVYCRREYSRTRDTNSGFRTDANVNLSALAIDILIWLITVLGTRTILVAPHRESKVKVTKTKTRIVGPEQI